MPHTFLVVPLSLRCYVNDEPCEQEVSSKAGSLTYPEGDNYIESISLVYYIWFIHFHLISQPGQDRKVPHPVQKGRCVHRKGGYGPDVVRRDRRIKREGVPELGREPRDDEDEEIGEDENRCQG